MRNTFKSSEEALAYRSALRRRVWSALEEAGVAAFPRPVYGRIPNFVGAEQAASRLVRVLLDAGVSAVFVNPDAPQAPVRRMLLEEGVKVYVSTPRISRGFVLLDPSLTPRGRAREASTISGLFKYGRAADPRDMPRIDAFVAGSVVVDHGGGRLGKGEGYSELEYAILAHFKLVDEGTIVATTVHDLQVVESPIPLMPWDLTVDLISTPTRLIRVGGPRQRPTSIDCGLIPRGKILEIPILRELCVQA
ncbi:5-formyltetrahydrofolate cyclo-ligase [Thermogladius sp.]|uniref:5-formyltetrahydrofolate cyclo-ligase n=1 Tax=Thermogladius sp. TaxID=2023064 RepID=UPI003D11F35A